jgi:thiamine-phosphate diphosphorylase
MEGLPPLHLVTDDRIAAAPDFLARVRAAAEAGGARVAVHLRAHGLTGRAFWDRARECRAAMRGTGARLWVNDRIDVALAVRADGVQLGHRSLDAATARRLLGAAPWVGRSVHAPEEVRAAEEEGADLVLLGPVYPTASHPAAPALGPDTVADAVGRTRLPVVAIGGLVPERVASVRARGAAGVAVRGHVWEAAGPADVGARVEAWLRAWDAAGGDAAGGDRR